MDTSADPPMRPCPNCKGEGLTFTTDDEGRLHDHFCWTCDGLGFVTTRPDGTTEPIKAFGGSGVIYTPEGEARD